MLADKLNEKVREIKKNSTEPTQEQIEKIAKKDAVYVWEALEKVFLKSVYGDEPLTVEVGYNKNEYDLANLNCVYFKFEGGLTLCKKLVRRKMKYLDETRCLVRELAKTNGISYKGSEYKQVYNGFFGGYVSAHWDTFTFVPKTED